MLKYIISTFAKEAATGKIKRKLNIPDFPFIFKKRFEKSKEIW